MSRLLPLLLVIALTGCSTLRQRAEPVQIKVDLHREALINVERPEGGISPVVIEYAQYGFWDEGDDCTTQSRELLVRADSVIYDPAFRRFAVWGRVLDAESLEPVSSAVLSSWQKDKTIAEFGKVNPDGTFSITHRFGRREVLAVHAQADFVTPYRSLYFDLRRLLHL